MWPGCFWEAGEAGAPGRTVLPGEGEEALTAGVPGDKLPVAGLPVTGEVVETEPVVGGALGGVVFEPVLMPAGVALVPGLPSEAPVLVLPGLPAAEGLTVWPQLLMLTSGVPQVVQRFPLRSSLH